MTTVWHEMWSRCVEAIRVEQVSAVTGMSVCDTTSMY
jgi:hypothetical protein